MNYCKKCGNKIDKNDKFCEKCGNKIDTIENKPTQKNDDKIKKNEKRRYIIGGIIAFLGITSLSNSKNILDVLSGILFALGGISLMPFIYEKFLNKINVKKLHIILPIIIFTLFCVAIPKNEVDNNNSIVEQENLDDNKKEDNKAKDNENNEDKTKDNKNNNDYSNLKKISNEKLKQNFINACKEINMEVSSIKKLQKKDDWNNGPRYTFTYKGTEFILYAYDNGEISSITIVNANLDKIWLEGYEPYDVNNYLLNAGVLADLQITAEASIKSVLNHPNTADFHWLTTGGYSKHNDIYMVSGKFDAKNSFGVESESSFYIEEKISNGSYSVVYMVIDGKKYIGNGSAIKDNDRKELVVENKENDNNTEIILKDGQKGSYGKEDLFDGEKYVRYYIPAGKYEVEALVKNATFFIETIKLHKEDGWDTATTIRKVQLSKMGDKDTIEIKSDECITLVIHTQIKLKKIS